MLKPIALAAVVAIGLSTAVAGQAARMTETDRAISRLGDLTPNNVRCRLTEMRPVAYQPGPVLLNEIAKRLNSPIISGRRVDRLHDILQPVLRYHQRDGKLAIFLIGSEQPRAYVVARAALVITTKLMLITSEAEMRGIVAHELAHEYLIDDREQAIKEKNGSLMREIELFCDVVAAITLKEIGDDPTQYGQALRRMTSIGIISGSATRHESETHPSLDARMALNLLLCRQLGQAFPAATEVAAVCSGRR